MEKIKFSSGDSPVFEGFVCGYQNFDNGNWVVPFVDEATYIRILLWLTTETHAMMHKELNPDGLFIGHSLDTLMSMPNKEWREVIRDYECEGMILNWLEIATAPDIFTNNEVMKNLFNKEAERFFNVGARIAWEEIEGEGDERI